MKATLARLLCALLAIVCPSLRGADANPPDRLTYQGYVVDASGVALGNAAPRNYDIVFRIWTDATSAATGDRLWTEQQAVTIDKGYFNVLLGEGAVVGSEARPSLATLFAGANASDRYLEITVKGIGSGGSDSTISPRLRLLTAPYAFLARQAGTLTDGGASLTAIPASALTSGSLDAARIPSLDASKITSGTLGTARIPDHDAAKITTGILGTARIPDLDAAKLTTGTLNASRLPSTVVRTDSVSAINPSGTTKLRLGGTSTTDAKRLAFGDAEYVYVGESATDDKMEIFGSKGIEITSNNTSGYIIMNTSSGKAMQVFANAIAGFHNTDKSKYYTFSRQDGSFQITVQGAMANAANNETTRTASYDGDSNWDFSSDRRLKTDIADAENVLNRVMNIRMRRFRWINGNPDAQPELGVIAQELEPILPELVSKATPSTPNPACPDGVYSVGLTSLGTYAIKAIQELKKEKDAEIAALREQNSLLRERLDKLSRDVAQVASLQSELAEIRRLIAQGRPVTPSENPAIISQAGAGLPSALLP